MSCAPPSVPATALAITTAAAPPTIGAAIPSSRNARSQPGHRLKQQAREIPGHQRDQRQRRKEAHRERRKHVREQQHDGRRVPRRSRRRRVAASTVARRASASNSRILPSATIAPNDGYRPCSHAIASVSGAVATASVTPSRPASSPPRMRSSDRREQLRRHPQRDPEPRAARLLGAIARREPLSRPRAGARAGCAARAAARDACRTARRPRRGTVPPRRASAAASGPDATIPVQSASRIAAACHARIRCTATRSPHPSATQMNGIASRYSAVSDTKPNQNTANPRRDPPRLPPKISTPPTPGDQRRARAPRRRTSASPSTSSAAIGSRALGSPSSPPPRPQRRRGHSWLANCTTIVPSPSSQSCANATMLIATKYQPCSSGGSRVAARYSVTGAPPSAISRLAAVARTPASPANAPQPAARRGRQKLIRSFSNTCGWCRTCV